MNVRFLVFVVCEASYELNIVMDVEFLHLKYDLIFSLLSNEKWKCVENAI